MRSWIAFLLCILVEIAAVSQKEVIVTMQTKRWTHILSDNFLSLTVTPEIALQMQDFSKSTMNMLKGLSPTMLRLGGPSTERMKFMPEKITSDNFTVTVSQWRRLNQFIEDVNMNLIVCLNSKDRVHGVWESRDAVELIYASENNGYKLGWELGYESENLQQEGVTGSQLGRDVARLKNILGDFTMYSDSPIIGPDMKSLSTPEEVRFLREYLEESADFLTAITWHPQFTSSHAEDEDVSNKFLGIIHGMENLIWNRSNGLRSPIQPPPKKPIWLAESKSDEYTGNFSDSLTWMKRLGAAARLGFPVIMKTLTATSLTTPTPDYWVSLLYKTLVGSAVMEVKYLAGNNRSTLQVFSHCAQTGTHEHEHDSVLAPGLHYMQGAVVLYGLNLDREETRLTVRGNVKEEAVHKYVLTAAQPNHHEMEASDEDQLENRKRSSPAKTLLNGQQLSLLPSGELPTISPVKERPSRTLSFNIPGRSVFFFVMPDMKLKTCMSFTNIQGSIEKVNAIERGQNLKGSILGATRNNVPANVPKFNFSPDKTTNLETKLHVDVYSDESLKSSPGIGLKGRLTDGRLNRGLVGLPRPRTALALDSSKPKIIEKGNILYNQIPTTNQKPDEQTKKTIEFEEEEATNGMQPFNDHEQAKSNTRFVMFSDDDWMSDFTHAKESVEVARKAIEAFDEAKLRDSKSPQNSFEEQIMNQKMSPSRQKIYDALAAAISEKENLSRMEKDSGTRNAEIDLNEGDNVEKVYNRERRDNMVQELASQDTEETPVTSSDILKQKNYDEKNKTRSTSSNIMTLVRSNNIVKNSSEERNQTYEQENSLQIPLKNSSFKNIEGQINLIDQITTPLSKENSSVITENPADLGNIELGEMVLKGNSQEESACFGQIESDLKVVTEDNAQNGDNDEVLKQKAERELNNYFEGISNGEVTLDGIDASDESGVSVENEDVKDLQPHSISLNNVNDKSCIIAYNKSTNGSKDVIEEQDLRSESLEFDNDGNFEESYEKQSIKENDKLQGTNLSDDALLSENEERAERGRREMFGSPFNYYDSRYNNPNQLTLREIKQLIDELAARKRELNNVMFNRQRKTPENNLKIKNFKESETGHTEVEDGLSAGPMRITIKDSVERTETSPIDDYKIDLINNDFSNIHYTIDEDGNRFEQTNRLYRQPQTDSENPGVIESSSNNSFDREMSQADSLNQDSEVGTSLISKPAIESSPADQLMNKGNVVLEDREPEKLETIISPSPTIVEESNNERSDDQILGKSPDSMNGDIHLTEVKGAPEIPTTYSKVVTVVTRDDKNVKLTKEKEVGSVKASKEKTVSSISSPKISAAQLRMERLEALRNRILESRRKIAKANLVSATAKPPQVINKISTEVSDTNAAPAPDVGENAPSGYLEEGAPTCKASRSAPYVEGIENWIDKIERDSQEIVRELPEDQKLLDTQNRSSTLGKFNAEEETLQHEKSKKIGSTKSNRPIMSIDGMREKQNGAQIISNKQGLGVLPFEEMNSPFIIIPTSYAIMPIKPKGSRAVKNTRGYRSHPLDGNLNIGDQLGDPPVIMQEGSSQDFRADSSLEENYAPQFRAGAGDIIPNSFPLTVADPDLTVSFMKNYGREKRSPDETVGSNDQTLNRGLLNLKGLNREFEGLRKNLQISENSKLKSLTPRISLAEIRSRALARITTLRESLNSSRLKTPIKSRETRAISNIEGRAKGRSALALSDDLETNEIPKRRGEYINMYEPKIDDRGLLNSDEFEKRMKPYSRAIPVSSRRSMDADIGNVGRENQVNVKQYSDNDYLVERMSMTDRAVVGLKHSVEELENTAKEILDKFRTSDYSNEERKKPSLQNILQNTFRVGRPREPKRTGALAFLNPIIDLALKFMRTLGIIS